jgi:hypothetical protein
MIKVQVFKISLPHASSRFWSSNLNESTLNLIQRKYTELEIDITTNGLILYSYYCAIAPKRDRPRKLWHWMDANDLYSNKELSGPSGYSTRGLAEYLIRYSRLSHTWLEKSEWDRLYAQREAFRFWDYGN